MFSVNQLLFISLTLSIRHEAGLGKIVGRRHDQVPDAARRQRPVDLAGHQAVVVAGITAGFRPLTPDKLRVVAQIEAVLLHFFSVTGKRQLPVAVVLDGLHELVRDQQRQIELPQAAVLRFARIKSIASGWPTSKVPICAPRRPPAEDTVKHMRS